MKKSFVGILALASICFTGCDYDIVTVAPMYPAVAEAEVTKTGGEERHRVTEAVETEEIVSESIEIDEVNISVQDAMQNIINQLGVLNTQGYSYVSEKSVIVETKDVDAEKYTDIQRQSYIYTTDMQIKNGIGYMTQTVEHLDADEEEIGKVETERYIVENTGIDAEQYPAMIYTSTSANENWGYYVSDVTLDKYLSSEILGAIYQAVSPLTDEGILDFAILDRVNDTYVITIDYHTAIEYMLKDYKCKVSQGTLVDEGIVALFEELKSVTGKVTYTTDTDFNLVSVALDNMQVVKETGGNIESTEAKMQINIVPLGEDVTISVPEEIVLKAKETEDTEGVFDLSKSFYEK